MAKEKKLFIITNGISYGIKYLTDTAPSQPVNWGPREEAKEFTEGAAKAMLKRVHRFFMTPQMVEVTKEK
jgi:hypothetical protein